jgi:hypothetical protein
VRILGEKSANDFLAESKGCVNPSVAFAAWRADCYTAVAEEYEGDVDLANLLTAWGLGFDSVQLLGLAPKEKELLKAYRLADDRGRESIVCSAQGQAEDWPRNTFAVPCPTNTGAV